MWLQTLGVLGEKTFPREIKQGLVVFGGLTRAPSAGVGVGVVGAVPWVLGGSLGVGCWVLFPGCWGGGCWGVGWFPGCWGLPWGVPGGPTCTSRPGHSSAPGDLPKPPLGHQEHRGLTWGVGPGAHGTLCPPRDVLETPFPPSPAPLGAPGAGGTPRVGVPGLGQGPLNPPGILGVSLHC